MWDLSLLYFEWRHILQDEILVHCIQHAREILKYVCTGWNGYAGLLITKLTLQVDRV
jgi:hypothetical protein